MTINETDIDPTFDAEHWRQVIIGRSGEVFHQLAQIQANASAYVAANQPHAAG